MSDHQSDLALQEVDEELRRERMRTLWKQYGKFIIGGAVGIVLVVAGRESWSHYTKTVELENAARFQAAVEAAEGSTNEAIAAWSTAAADLSEGYAALARFRLAAGSLAVRDVNGAIAAYDAIAADGSVSESYQDLARLLAAMIVIDAKEDLDDARGRLSVIAVQGRTWYYSATEQLGLLELQAGDQDAALSRFSALSLDPSTPATMRARAAEYETLLRAPIETVSVPSDADADGDAVSGADVGPAEVPASNDSSEAGAASEADAIDTADTATQGGDDA